VLSFPHPHRLTGARPTTFERSVVVPIKSVAVFCSAALISGTAMPAIGQHSVRYEAGRAVRVGTGTGIRWFQ